MTPGKLKVHWNVVDLVTVEPIVKIRSVRYSNESFAHFICLRSPDSLLGKSGWGDCHASPLIMWSCRQIWKTVYAYEPPLSA